MNQQMFDQVKAGKGFIAALDQSGGSTPKALKLYGIDETEYSGDAAMFDLIHQMRSRLIKSKVFNGDRIVGAILFEMTMERQIDGIGSAEFLWNNKKIVPFLKIDNGLAAESNDVQLMKPIPELSARIAAANKHGVFGTKMRSVINLANAAGVEAVVAQQFEIGKEIIAGGLIPLTTTIEVVRGTAGNERTSRNTFSNKNFHIKKKFQNVIFKNKRFLKKPFRPFRRSRLLYYILIALLLATLFTIS